MVKGQHRIVRTPMETISWGPAVFFTTAQKAMSQPGQIVVCVRVVRLRPHTVMSALVNEGQPHGWPEWDDMAWPLGHGDPVTDVWWIAVTSRDDPHYYCGTHANLLGSHANVYQLKLNNQQSSTFTQLSSDFKWFIVYWLHPSEQFICQWSFMATITQRGKLSSSHINTDKRTIWVIFDKKAF